jgi:hypothetical protein
MTTGKRWVASRSTGPAPHVAAGPVGRLSRSLILETGEIYLILTRPVNISAVLDAQDGDEMYRVVDLVQDAEGPSPCGVWCELRSNGALVHAAAGALRRAQLRQGRGR